MNRKHIEALVAAPFWAAIVLAVAVVSAYASGYIHYSAALTDGATFVLDIDSDTGTSGDVAGWCKVANLGTSGDIEIDITGTFFAADANGIVLTHLSTFHTSVDEVDTRDLGLDHITDITITDTGSDGGGVGHYRIICGGGDIT